MLCYVKKTKTSGKKWTIQSKIKGKQPKGYGDILWMESFVNDQNAEINEFI